MERWLIAVVLVGVALRVAFGLATLFPVEAMTLGDAWSYWASAQNLLATGVITDSVEAGPQFFRPPLYPIYLAGVMAIAGATPWAVMVGNALVSATGSISCARIAARCWPRLRWLPAASAVLYALDPIQVAFPGTLLSESLAVPLALGFVWLLLAALARPTGWLPWAAGALGGLLVNLRVDLVVVAIGGFALCAWVYWRRGRARPWRPWLGAATVTLVLCVPWSLYASKHQGKPTFMAMMPVAAGLDLYSTTLRLSLNEWMVCEHGYMLGLVPPEHIPAAAFSGPSEEAEVRRLLADVRRYGAPRLTVDDRLRELARERIAAGRLRYYVGLPLWRSLQLWLHHEKGTNRLYARDGKIVGATPDLFEEGASVLASLACVPYVLLCFLGFVTSWAVFARSRGPRAVIAGLILGRTYSLLFAGLLAGRAAFEVRYLTQVQPLALVVCLGVAGSLLAGARTRRAG